MSDRSPRTDDEGRGVSNSNDASESQVVTAVRQTLLCIVGDELRDDATLLEALKVFDTEIRFSADGSEFMAEPESAAGSEEVEETSSTAAVATIEHVAFVVSSFESSTFAALRRLTARIFGPVAVLYYARRKHDLPHITRPLFCASMNRIVVCFTGFTAKEELANLVNLVHHMGGSIRKEFRPSVTHLIASDTAGQKYKYASTLGKPVMRPEWVIKCWENKMNVDFVSADLPLSEYQVRPFTSCKIAFWGFQAEEQCHMEDLTSRNGGDVCLPDNPDVTHIVYEEHNDFENQPLLGSICGTTAYLVKAEWFWVSIQMDKRAKEDLYPAKGFEDNAPSNGGTPNIHLTPNSRIRKRKRLRETLGLLANSGGLEGASGGVGICGGVASPTIKQRRSEELAGLSLSPSLLDATVSPTAIDKTQDHDDDETTAENLQPVWSTADMKNMSARQQVCYELLQTETNYTGILQTICTVIKDPIEDPTQIGGPLLDPTEVKIIFGNLQPIYEVHKQMKADLVALASSWKEESSIGKVILKYSQDFMKAYPPFVNFFEESKEMLQKCDSTKPRFHAFLQICKGKPECGRQSLFDLLIRPVQRLPSVILLINDILKQTSKTNPDHTALEEAITCLKDVMMHINEDKRKTEGQLAMFGIVNQIENCPANLLSSHRSFITKADMTELGDGLSGKGESLTLFLFTDVIEICKRRKSASSTMGAALSSGSATLSARSPSVISLHTIKSAQKNYKHVELMPLSHIKRVVNITETEDCHNVFALVCRSNLMLKERLYVFTLVLSDGESGRGEKLAFLRTLCRHLANAMCRPDAENYLTSVEPHKLDILSSDIAHNTLSKAVRFASKTSKKVGRAFSFTKTPRRLSRAVSTMISPMPRSAGGDTPTKMVHPLLASTQKYSCGSTQSLQTSGTRLTPFRLHFTSDAATSSSPSQSKTPDGR